MLRTWLRCAVSAVLFLCIVPAAAAAPIQITSGTLTGTYDETQIHLMADGFALTGSGHYIEGVWSPGMCFGDCLPGQTYELDARWSGKDFPGTARIDGDGLRDGIP